MLRLHEIQQAFAEGMIEGSYNVVAKRSCPEARPCEMSRSIAA